MHGQRACLHLSQCSSGGMMLYFPEDITFACHQRGPLCKVRGGRTIISDFILSRWFVFAYPSELLMGSPSRSQRYGLHRFARFLPFFSSESVFAFGIAVDPSVGPTVCRCSEGRESVEGYMHS